MASSIKFDGLTVKGQVGLGQVMPPETHALVRYYWATKGVTEIISGVGAGQLVVDFWMFDKYTTYNAYVQDAKKLEGKQARHGTLVLQVDDKPNLTSTWTKVTLYSAEQVAVQGRESGAPMIDVAGTLDGGWWGAWRLTFLRLGAGLASEHVGAGGSTA